jgi:large subunit ribosomal protein L5
MSETTAPRPAMPRLKQRYRDEIAPQLKEQLGLDNVMQIPTLEKIVVNVGLGEAVNDAKALEGAIADLATITGQKPRVNRARKSIAGFKLREGMPIGVKVTLRGDRMWEFFDRLLSVALPRIRDFRGLKADRLRRPRQLHLRPRPSSSCSPRSTTTRSTRSVGWTSPSSPPPTDDEQGRALLDAYGFPFVTVQRAWHGEELTETWRRSRRSRQVKRGAKVQRAELHALRALRPAPCRLPRFKLCRVCFREMAHAGELPGIRKASW